MNRAAILFVHGRAYGRWHVDSDDGASWINGLKRGFDGLGLDAPTPPSVTLVRADYGEYLEQIRLAVGNAHHLPPDVVSDLGGDPELATSEGHGTTDRPVRACLECVGQHQTRVRLKRRVRMGRAVLAHNQMLSRLVINRGMADIVRWLAMPAVRAEIRRKILQQAPAIRPLVVIGHSLGSLVALDALAHGGLSPDLLITCGSPISLPTITTRLDQAVRDYAQQTEVQWLNIFDPGDIVTGGKWVRRAIAPSVANWHVDNGAEAHSAERYLTHPPVAQAIHSALRGNT